MSHAPRTSRTSNLPLVAAVLFLVPAVASAAELDVFNRPVPFADGRPTVTLLANSDSAKTVSAPMAELSFALRDLRPVVIVRVDLRGIPGLFQGVARSSMRASNERGLENFKRECATHNAPVPADIAKGLYFVADGSGDTAKAAGLEKGFATSIAIVFDGAGREVARGPFPAESRGLQKALRMALAKQVVLVAVAVPKVVKAPTAKRGKHPLAAAKASTHAVALHAAASHAAAL